MKPCYSLIIIACSLFFGSSRAQQRPPSANEVLKEATEQAAREKKNVLVIFHASWCGWCHKMDSSLNDKSCTKFFDDNYVIRHLVVYESADKKNLENPGAYQLLTKYHGNDEGIPFWLIFDKDGKLLADSQIRVVGTSQSSPGENVGCPASEKEVAYFIAVLKKTSHITQEEETVIQRRFRQNEE